MAEEYSHTQIGYFLLFVYSAVITNLGVVIVMTGSNSIALIGILVMSVVMGLFSTLTVHVGKRMLRIRFGLGVIRQNFLLEDIETVRVVKNPWYYGWGIRYTPRGWLYSVSGLSAIELQMKNGRRYRIGTDDPMGLTEALGNTLKNFHV